MNNQLRGTALILLSALFYGSYGVWSRLMVGSFGEFSQAWTRGLLLLSVVLVANWKWKLFCKVKGEDWKWFVPIAMAGGLNQAPYFFGFEHLEIGTATLLFYAALVVGGYVLGKIFFAEKLTRVKMASLLVAIAGMFSIYGWSLTSSQIFPATMTILAGLMGASTVILPKKLIGNYHELQMMAGYFLLQVVFNLPLSIWSADPLPPITLNEAWGGQLGYAVTTLLANMAAITGFGYLEPSIGSLIGLAEILFGILFGIVLFGEALNMGVMVGGMLIILAAALPSVADMLGRRQTSARASTFT